MATVVVMPQLSSSVESCLIVSWQVGLGDEIAENTIVCEVETDKASMEVPTSAAGTVLAILWDEGDDVPVKEPLLVVGVAGEDGRRPGRGRLEGAGAATELPSPVAAAAEAAPDAEAPAAQVERVASTASSRGPARWRSQPPRHQRHRRRLGPRRTRHRARRRRCLAHATKGSARATASTAWGPRPPASAAASTTSDLVAGTQTAETTTTAPATPAAGSREFPGASSTTPLKGASARPLRIA